MLFLIYSLLDDIVEDGKGVESKPDKMEDAESGKDKRNRNADKTGNVLEEGSVEVRYNFSFYSLLVSLLCFIKFIHSI